MRKHLEDHRHGGEHSQRGTWAKTFRDFYADEAKAAGLPIEKFLDLVGDRLQERGQRPRHFRRTSRTQRWRERSSYFSNWLEQ
jgi:hypothetical protein